MMARSIDANDQTRNAHSTHEMNNHRYVFVRARICSRDIFERYLRTSNITPHRRKEKKFGKARRARKREREEKEEEEKKREEWQYGRSANVTTRKGSA